MLRGVLVESFDMPAAFSMVNIQQSEICRMLNGGISVDFINTKAAIRGSAWQRQTEQLCTLHPDN